jgi:hypothetical protein
MTDDLDPVRGLRPDRLLPDDPIDPGVLTHEKHRLMSTITGSGRSTRGWPTGTSGPLSIS